MFRLRNRKYFSCLYRVIAGNARGSLRETRNCVGTIAQWWEREYEVRVFPRSFEFFATFHKFFYSSIGRRKKCFLFPLLLNSLLKMKKNINNVLNQITFIQISI